MENHKNKDGLIKLTGLWEKRGKNGVYFQGKLGYSANILIFENQYKSSEQDPDYILYLARSVKKEPPVIPEDHDDDIQPL